ncbi:MAG: ATP-binding protein [Acidimicrobiales bacterium]
MDAPVDYQTIFQTFPGCVLLLDADLVVRDASERYLEVTLTTRDAIVGRSLFDVFPVPDDPDGDGSSNVRASMEQVVREGRAHTMALQRYDIPRPVELGGGFELRWWEPENSPVFGPDGQVRFVVHHVSDRTQRVQMERERDENEAQLAQRQADLEQAIRDLELANAAKNQFLSRMSHELRTPMNAVLGFAQLLRLDDLSPEQGEAVDHILQAGAHLLQLIDEVLDISRIESGALAVSMESLDVADVVDEVQQLLRPMAATERIALRAPAAQRTDLLAHADRQRVKQILLNLVTNAIKYGHAGGNVSIEGEQLDGAVRVRVIDDGRGIDPADRELVFAPFERLGDDQHLIQGIGIGLALSRGLAEVLGGTLDFESAPGEGSTFWVDLPAADVPPSRGAELQARRSALATVAGPPTRSIVYVEDNPLNVRLVERILQDRGDVEVVHVPLGRDGHRTVRDRKPALVLLDLHLPDVHGEEVLARLLADPETASIPVVVLSADASPGQVDRLVAAGAEAYLPKPFDIRELQDLVERLLPA